MHKVSIKSDENGNTRLILDGQDISSGCFGFSMQKNGGEFPTITITLSCKDLEVELEKAKVEVDERGMGRTNRRAIKWPRLR